ncbi:aldo/keto reductase [Phycisphaera mikurensis]|uniref:Putative aldo/keto reductase n=1 Tax=Phycisphaera mikurensis (strain NBRC 102666 / KCTC 22515 / FYK2301M01) TaxID=1142394 RepID=I0IFL2_PHYMF|nr:aldo/keto reductase [Phycisphaera mikurensis]MBB6440558.1 aryl-alcohol dehydrogenase-like predicted oxidoreductase [Phycisphaera mikurensis]BAM04050.1 putative aldo/keto reductase [Phycisphaera mikurensis NBRC 102666]
MPENAPLSKNVPSSLDDYQLLGDSGLRVSPLCLGTMNFGEDWGTGADKETSKKVFDAYAEAGGNFLDTADFYTNGSSESFVGEFIASERDRFVLATKYTIKRADGQPMAAGNSRLSMHRAVEASLKRLKTDHIDLYWLHMWDFTTPTDELVRAFDDLVKAGKIGYVAISDTPAWKLCELVCYARHHALTRPVATQVEYSLITRDVEREIAPMALEMGLGLLPWSPLKGGVLSGKYGREDLQKIEAGEKKGVGKRDMKWDEQRVELVEGLQKIGDAHGKTVAQVAQNWLLSRPAVPSVIVGPRTPDHLEGSLGALGFDLSEDEQAEIQRLAPIELGFPHDFLRGGNVRGLATAGTRVPRRAYGRVHPLA